MPTHEHHAGEFGSIRKPGLKKDSEFAVHRARMSLDKAKSAIDKRRNSKSPADREAYAREAKRHLENAQRHVSKADHPSHATEAKTISDHVAKLHSQVHDKIEQDSKAANEQKTEPIKQITKTSTPMGAFGAMALADIKSNKAITTGDHLKKAKEHLDRAGVHDLSSISGSNFDRLRHTASAMSAGKSATVAARRVLAHGTEQEKKQAYKIIQRAAEIRQSARDTLSKSDTTTSREIESRARMHGLAATSAQQMADKAGSESERAIHQRAADKSRREASKAVAESRKRLEETGEGYGSQQALDDLLKTLKKRKKRGG